MSEQESKDTEEKAAQELAPIAARALTRRYVLALGAVAVLVIAGQVGVQYALGSQERDGHVINVAGRQRMLSQSLTKTALLLRSSFGQQLSGSLVGRLRQDLGLWRSAHYGLLRGDTRLGLPGDNSSAVVELFADVEPEFEAMSASLESLSGDARQMRPAAVEALVVDILGHEARYLQVMDQIVATYEGEAHQRVTTLRAIEIVLMSLALLVLALEARFVFRPAVRRLRGAIEALEEAKARYARLSAEDPLTGLANRRSFDESLTRELRRARRQRQPLSLLLVDVDRLKVINDEHGHSCGDDSLRHVAEVLRTCARRAGDLTARVGGDEFAIVLTETDGAGALNVADELCSSLARTTVSGPSARSNALTVGASVGIATVGVSDIEREPSAVYRAADDALYSAKREGLGRANIAEPGAPGRARTPSAFKLEVVSGDK